MWSRNTVPRAENLTVQAGGPPAEVFPNGIGGMTSPSVATHYVPSERTQHVFFADKSGTPWEIWWSGPGPKTPENLHKLKGVRSADIALPAHSLVAADGASM